MSHSHDEDTNQQHTTIILVGIILIDIVFLTCMILHNHIEIINKNKKQNEKPPSYYLLDDTAWTFI